jgi:hypothetical protein
MVEDGLDVIVGGMSGQQIASATTFGRIDQEVIS